MCISVTTGQHQRQQIKTFECVTINSRNKESHSQQARYLESQWEDIITCVFKQSLQ